VKTIWKFPLPGEISIVAAQIGVFDLKMPDGAHILSVGVQAEQPVLWALVDPEAPLQTYHLCVAGTGQPLPPEIGLADAHFIIIGTFQIGWFVGHVFLVP
jgi:hypothetical protein